MKVLNLTADSKIYTCNAYLVTGSWNAMADVNTLIDVGRDRIAIEKINKASTGVGKRRVEQVVLTHSHYDHASLLPQIQEAFHPRVYAFSRSLKGVDLFLNDGDGLRVGDRNFEVIHTPGHSNDSICLYCEAEGALFAGDTPVVSVPVDGTYSRGFFQAMEKLCRRDIRTVYFGHGPPLSDNCNRRMRAALNNVKNALRHNPSVGKA